MLYAVPGIMYIIPSAACASSHIMCFSYACSQEESGPKEQGHGHSLGVGHFEGLRNHPYMTEGWQPGHQLTHPVPHHPQPLHHPQAHNLLQERNWPSAFAPTQRQDLPFTCPFSKARALKVLRLTRSLLLDCLNEDHVR